jgi:hypothetical protein
MTDGDLNRISLVIYGYVSTARFSVDVCEFG